MPATYATPTPCSSNWPRRCGAMAGRPACAYSATTCRSWPTSTGSWANPRGPRRTCCGTTGMPRRGRSATYACTNWRGSGWMAAAGRRADQAADSRRCRRPGSARGRIESDDVVFFQVIAALHFDHDQVALAGVAQLVQCAGGDVGRLVALDQGLLLAVDHFGDAIHHHPVLAAMVMHLQR